MIAKITTGKTFHGCVKYVANKPGAELIGTNGVDWKNYNTVADSMELQSQMNPKLGKKVGHISLNFSTQDRVKLSNEMMLQIASEYMKKMKINDTQAIVYRHHDRDHPHCHIVFNRVSNSGRTISDKNDRVRSTKICRQLTEAYNLYIKNTDAKQNVHTDRLREPDKTKYEIYDAITATLKNAQNWEELSKQLKRSGIGITFKCKGGTDEKQGVIFHKNGYSFNGSKIDRQYSYSKINSLLFHDKQKINTTSINKSYRSSIAPERKYNQHVSDGSTKSDHGMAELFSVFKTGNLNGDSPAEPQENQLMKKRKKKKRGLKL